MTRLKTAILATALIALSAPAFAQPVPGGPPPPNGQMREQMRQRMGEQFRAKAAEREAALKQVLKITPGQEGAFAAWTAALHPRRPEGARGPGGPRGPEGRGPEGRRMGPDAQGPAMTTPERIDRRLAFAQKRLEIERARGDATKRFYVQLSPDQQRTFDSLPMLRGREGDMRHGGRGGPRGRGEGRFGGEHPMGPPPAR